MKLLTIRMHNFRQFYGTTPKIHFSHGNKNVTVFHGNNGSGKTTLLNAFTWAMYDSVTVGFQMPDQIINKRAIREAEPGANINAWVEIEFEGNDRRYLVRRTAQALRTKEEPGWTNLRSGIPSLQHAGSDGHWKNEEQVYDTIGRALPKDLHTYFFFDGERIERIVQPTTKEREEIGAATKMLLGVEVLHRAEEHLIKARRELEKELREVGDAETSQLVSQKQELENKLEVKANWVKHLRNEKGKHQDRLQEIAIRLNALEEVRDIQQRREFIEKELARNNSALTQERESLCGEISDHGYTVFLRESIANFQSMIQALRDRGDLPSGIKKQFVQALLASQSCICARELLEGSDARRSVEAWMKKAESHRGRRKGNPHGRRDYPNQLCF